MKKFTLFAVAALMVVVSAVAQPRGKVMTQTKKVSKTAQAKVPERPVLKISDVKTLSGVQSRQLPKAAMQRLSLGKQQKVAGKTALAGKRRAAAKAQRRADGIITEQPAGTYYNMKVANQYYVSTMFGDFAGNYDEAVGEVVEGSDGCLYIHNMLTDFFSDADYWLKAEKVDGTADTYVIHEQPIYVEDYYGQYYTYSIMKCLVADGKISIADNTDIQVTWKDGVLRTADEFNNESMDVVITAIDDSGYWCGVMNWDITMTEQTSKAITELPVGVEPVDMVVKYADGTLDDEGNPNMAGDKVKMAVNGSDIYLQFYSNIDSWIKGTISGNKVTFPSVQYLGGDKEYNMHTYFIAAKLEGDEAVPVDAITFDYDASAMTLGNSGMMMLANGGQSEIYYLKLFDNPEFKPYVEVAATPAPATGFDGMNYDPYYGYGYMDFSIPNVDVDGNYIDPAKMSYKVYVGDDENNTVFTFDPSEYPELEEATTEIPYDFSSNNFWTNGASHEFTHYVNKPKNFGVQVIYKGGGETRTSEIAWFWDNNGAGGFESVFPSVENPVVNTETLADGEMALNLGEANYGFGSGQMVTETYDVAMKVADSWASGVKLSGKKVKAISVPFLSTEGIIRAKVWLSTSIALNDDGTFTPNGPVKEFTISDNGYTTVQFDEPYEIPAYDETTDQDGLYIGYTFTQLSNREAEESATPVVLTGTTNVGGFMIHTNKVYRLGWASMEGVEGDLALEAVLTGGEENAAEMLSITDSYQETAKGGQVSASIANYGYKGLQSFSANYQLLGDGVEKNGTFEVKDLDIAPVFGGYTTVKIDIPAVEKAVDGIFYANITTVNGQDNAVNDVDAQCNVFVKNFMPKKRPLLEEYTGTWCGYCPRGYVALEKMAELYPEDFVALSYHNGDPMEFITVFPSDVQGFPAAYLDRDWEVDAYYGIYDEDFGIERTWQERSQQFGVADIDVEASFSEDMKTINIKSTTKFAGNEEGVSYQIGYAVVADGLTGTGSSWAQSNYYAEQAEGTPLYMENFYDGPDHVEGLVFNDVIVATSPYEGVVGSLPETVAEGTPYTHTYSFNVDEIVNTAGEPIIQDMSKVKVVAMLLNWGQVKNANKCQVTTIGTGINDATATAGRAVKTEYFDLSGRKVLLPGNGVYVKSVQYKNGQTVNSKVVIK